MPSHRLRALAALTLVTAALPLAACSSASDASNGPSAPSASGPSAAPSFAPVTLDNCGTKVTVTSPPQRVVTIKSSTTEAMLALGLGDRLVGTAFADGPVPADEKAAYDKVPVLSDTVPGQESVLATSPDFVYAGWESNFSAQGAGDRAALARLGIGTYVSPSACKEKGYQPDPLTFDDVDAEIREVGRIFGVPDRAEALVAREHETLASVTKPATPPRALWWSSGNGTPYVGAGIGAPQMIMDAAGLTNVFAGVHDTWTSAGWEDVVAADPDVIVLVDASWNPAEAKKKALAANPATAALRAVKEQRYVVLPFAATEAGVRNAEAVASIDEQLAKLGS
ncbi:putative F420-0 ABC transporter substrate-binding protein [Cellulomonas alba]|uniref:F420-0 ABC transporter substrate-binding protein n=1 Tax=Cellulomonas alba TaxID=3053467 RepID=A0ABT7SIN4_9CELL|nr:putative F420-0 ABC transporter substrate-binding protein [Cellulomonas alba]MDM7856044.1 putative F420-0 ABC transporter substrate-binding protein [Cellulomonas alba]